MMEILHHILGVCSDNHAHFDLYDLFIFHESIKPIIIQTKINLLLIFNKIKSLIFFK